MAYHNSRKRAPKEEQEIDLVALQTAVAAEELANLEAGMEKE
jgi:hypothetical protein